MQPAVVTTSGTVALRTALIWHGEVMDDVVCTAAPRPVTLGTTGSNTFTVPQVGLPENFAIIRPGARGYLLTLGANMRGTISVEGKERSVAEFVQHGDVGGSGFHATPISGRDWGVVELDDSGEFKLFFQFVPVDQARSAIVPLTLAGLGIWFALGILLSIGSFFLFNYRFPAKDVWSDYGPDAFLDGFALATLGMGLIVIPIGGVVAYIRSELELQLSHLFSFLAHGALLVFGIIVYQPNNPYVWPGERSMTGAYLVQRLQDDPPPEPPKPAVGAQQQQDAAKKNDNKKKVDTATENDAGNSGGKGDTERARTTHPVNDKPAAPPVALLDKKNQAVINNIIDQNLQTDLTRFQGIASTVDKSGSLGFGKASRGTGVGDNCRPGMACSGTRGDSTKNGNGGGGHVAGDFESHRPPLDTGKDRPGGNCVGESCKGAAPKEVKVGLQGAGGDLGGLSAEEIDRVVRGHAGLFKACYQKELNHTPGIGGKMVVHFIINGEGSVTSANSNGGLGNAEVESCVVRNIKNLKFPAKGGNANVNYPFVFSQGG
jgi:TonB family protein|nr:AgmX/PglI C-terminal domain-containing protein [Kofleriaceae bacterium]